MILPYAGRVTFQVMIPCLVPAWLLRQPFCRIYIPILMPFHYQQAACIISVQGAAAVGETGCRRIVILRKGGYQLVLVIISFQNPMQRPPLARRSSRYAVISDIIVAAYIVQVAVHF